MLKKTFLFAIIVITLFSCNQFDATKMNNEFVNEIQKMDRDMGRSMNGLSNINNIGAIVDSSKAILPRMDASIKKIEDYKAGGKGGEEFKAKVLDFFKASKKVVEVISTAKNFTPEQTTEANKWIDEVQKAQTEAQTIFEELQKAQEVFAKENEVKMR